MDSKLMKDLKYLCEKDIIPSPWQIPSSIFFTYTEKKSILKYLFTVGILLTYLY